VVGSSVALDHDDVLELAAGDALTGDVAGPAHVWVAGVVRGAIDVVGDVVVWSGGRVDGPVRCRRFTLCTGGQAGADICVTAGGAGPRRQPSRPPVLRGSFVPHGFTVHGDVYAAGDLRVAGHIEGDVRVGGQLVVVDDGCVDGITRSSVDVSPEVGREAARPSETTERQMLTPTPTAPRAASSDLPRVGRVAARRRHSGTP